MTSGPSVTSTGPAPTAPAAKAELHQELVEACRWLGRCTTVRARSRATLVTHNRELDERLRGGWLVLGDDWYGACVR